MGQVQRHLFNTVRGPTGPEDAVRPFEHYVTFSWWVPFTEQCRFSARPFRKLLMSPALACNTKSSCFIKRFSSLNISAASYPMRERGGVSRRWGGSMLRCERSTNIARSTLLYSNKKSPNKDQRMPAFDKKVFSVDTLPLMMLPSLLI